MLAVGSCAAWGGVTAAGESPTDACGLQYEDELPGGLLGAEFRSASGLPVINIAGCPTHPNWVLDTLAALAADSLAAADLDALARPRFYADQLVHHGCTRNEYYEFKASAVKPSDLGCLMEHMGCKGTQVHTYPQPDGTLTLPAGVWQLQPGGAQVLALQPEAISEDASRSWLESGPAGAEGAAVALHPWSGLTRPAPDKADAYTWNKAPRWAGQVVETGALARQLVAGQPLVCEAVALHGCSVLTRVLARALELAQVLPLMERWLQAIQPGEAFCVPAPLPDAGRGMGLTEAARGSLGHWVVLQQGRIANYQIVAPTSWNFAPRDAAGVPGALEQALVGAPVRAGEDTPVAVQHVVRSFDPCMVCTVH